ncbi:glycolate oxidase iron-sulfur subunit [Malonomonas rubra DSM 5091]|uniref:Glycolate oxidase iron-sulfur subunit n=1 Tax=Malonomonas rubra DSM 5091 TaxID=1122189 RepID=A0A1M6GBL4_MALRU|nr:(Fe-S)-binding protein [Malonomonas rubra]SHJ07378.1 glycolate oxidase iron-sulfur subunit [Malonomonas rubra DSM 5091]
MAKLKQLEDYREEIDQCVKCGCCRAHCPAFGAVKHEGRVARGKIALADALLKGDVEMEERFLLDMSQCLLCGSCYSQCPNKVPTEEIVAATRLKIAEKKGLSTFGKGVATVLKHQGLMDFGAKAGGKLSSLLFKKLPEDSGMQLRFPAPFVTKDRTLPPITAKPFRDRHPEFIEGEKDKPTVLFFTGCGINYMYPESGDAMIRALKFLGINIIIPKDQNCCGLPAVSAGAAETVETLAEKNQKVFAKHNYDYIVTACASCNSGLKNVYPGMGDEFADYPEKVKDIFVFLVEQGFADKLDELPKAAQRIKVTYHDPCHLRNHGVTKEPRAILKALPQVEYVEMENAGSCCGLGGTYSVYHYDTAKQIGAKKANFINESGAELVATDCPGCIMQLQDSINHAGGKQKILHILDLVADALPD